ncbi:NUDIX hydrolase [bacterium 1XD42-8]|jgi:ADP-ribose pyrophosphatase|nr:NUDIX hydrolase [Lachnospiraceae bacterium]RKJ39645.1 NUDIX hydrolase [bacterium 1XD42-8]
MGENKKFQRIGRRMVGKGHVYQLYEDELILPDKRKVYYDHVEHMGAAAVLPVLEDGRVILVSQYRNSIERMTLEIPAGGLSYIGEPTDKAALRELEEETGYRGDKAELLLKFCSAPAFCNEKIDIYLVRHLRKVEQKLDEDEFIDVVIETVENLIKKIYMGEIEDSKTMAALFAYAYKFC